jgi:NAD(P)-dependent dehydrogenase (short-subunit alcohol dehydrogenase family)
MVPATAQTMVREEIEMSVWSVSGKVVLITGASSGIGAATARALHNRGANVVLTSRRQPILDALAAQLGSSRVLAISADVADREALDRVVSVAVERFGGLHVVIANAGIAADPPSTVAAINERQFERVIEVNLLGAWHTVRASMPQIIAQHGHIVVTASVYAYTNGVINAAYAISKAGVEQLGRALRVELAPHRATAGVLYPGWTRTALINAAFGENQTATAMLKRGWPRPLRTPITPERVAAATVRGIEQRSARITVPARWIPISMLRGIVNPVSDRMLEHDPKLRELILKLEQETPVHLPTGS